VEGDITVTGAGRLVIQISEVGGTFRAAISGEVHVSDLDVARIVLLRNDSVEMTGSIADRAIVLARNNEAFLIPNAFPTINCVDNDRVIALENQSSDGNTEHQ
jgi:hypothetical protein